MSPSRKLLALRIMGMVALLHAARTTQGLFSDDINVKITNTLEGQLGLGVNNTQGLFCGFVFENKLHWFDIYLDKRDLARCSVAESCNWFIKKDGPCYGSPYSLDNCYPWNQD